LLRLVNNDFSTAIIGSYFSPDFYFSSFERGQIAELRTIGGKNHARKRAAPVIRAKIQKGVPGTRRKHPKHAPRDAGVFAAVPARGVEVQASAFRVRFRGPRRFRARRVTQAQAIG